MDVDVSTSVALGGIGSAWRSDGAFVGGLRTGIEFGDIAAVELLGRIGYATVDERLIELVGIGGRFTIPVDPVRPYARVGLVHQHESPVAGVPEDPFGALFGVGDAIRHRGGFEFGLGAAFPFAQTRYFSFYAHAEAVVDWFPDERGPSFYAGGNAGVGFDYTIGGR